MTRVVELVGFAHRRSANVCVEVASNAIAGSLPDLMSVSRSRTVTVSPRRRDHQT